MVGMLSPRNAIELVDALRALGFPDHLFRTIHPMGHSMSRYRAYCEAKERFTRVSSSNVLCAHLKAVLDGAMRLAPLRPMEAQWQSLVEGALSRDEMVLQTARDTSPGGATACTPAPAGNRTQTRTHRRLEAEHEAFIAAQIAALIRTAANPTHSMTLVARWQIRNTLWRWTVDGVDASGFVQIDMAKRVHGLLPMTRDASNACPSIKRVHEHVVPRGLLATYLIERQETNRDRIIEFLRRYCLAAIVTKAEDDLLRSFPYRLGQRMPDGWNWGDDPWARYKTAGLFERLLWPDDWPVGSASPS
jgi:hypothetical protein